MPTYDYVCADCSYQFEEFQSITSEPLESCPKCNGPVERLIGGGNGLIFKGSGFYITDYKNSKNTSAPDSKPKPKSKSSSKEDASSKPPSD
ncbi:MAG: FmdB family zinc ribbon protein [bacterium]